MNSDWHQILESTKFKDEHLWTVSRKLKSDLIEFFSGKGLRKAVEVSGWHGYTTRILSFLFRNVVYVEAPEVFADCSKIAKSVNRDRENIDYIPLDAYRDPWQFEEIDVFFIDCEHRYEPTCSDIDNALGCLATGGYLVFDDYSYPEDAFGVRRAIDDACRTGKIRVITFIGSRLLWSSESAFSIDASGLPEGVICQKLEPQQRLGKNDGIHRIEIH